MCGIHLSISHDGFRGPSDGTKRLLRNRGPDSAHQHDIVITSNDLYQADPLYASFFSTVLSLQGEVVVSQPLVDKITGSVLCWNGEAWKIRGIALNGNDTESIFDLLLTASAQDGNRSGNTSYGGMIDAIASISGPYAFVFYDAPNRRLFYGRDCLGRRSLLKSNTNPDELLISSICDNQTGENWAEVEADGIYMVEFFPNNLPSKAPEFKSRNFQITHIPSLPEDRQECKGSTLTLPYPHLNKTLPGLDVIALGLKSPSVDLLEERLRGSLGLRILNLGHAALHGKGSSGVSNANIAILFSGGLDCTVLARLCHDILPAIETVDLLNVAFQNPRVHKNTGIDGDSSPYELCPDRITGRKSYVELQQVCPNRIWRFVEVNVPYTETVAHREKVVALMHPHNTEMDLSISYALYFASRGSGHVEASDGCRTEYTTSARVLLSGLGADELFGGYQRHATGYSRHGFPGLLDELELDINRLGKRNLGRDDRVISNWAREARFPYLDEDLLAWALDAPVWEKCGFGQEDGRDDEPEIEPGKKVLRLLAWKLGMDIVATEKKRAIQFGARTAKMEIGKTKGTHLIT